MEKEGKHPRWMHDGKVAHLIAIEINDKSSTFPEDTGLGLIARESKGDSCAGFIGQFPLRRSETRLFIQLVVHRRSINLPEVTCNSAGPIPHGG